MNGELHTSALMRMLLTCWPSIYPQGRSVGNLYGCYFTIWHHRVCDWVTLTVGQSPPFRGGLPLYLSWLKGISGEILLQSFSFFVLVFTTSSVLLELVMTRTKQSNFKLVKINPFKDWEECFRSFFDRQTGASDRQNRVSVVRGKTMIPLWLETEYDTKNCIKCMLHNKLRISVMLCYYQAVLVNVYVLRLNTSIQHRHYVKCLFPFVLLTWCFVCWQFTLVTVGRAPQPRYRRTGHSRKKLRYIPNLQRLTEEKFNILVWSVWLLIYWGTG